MSNFFETPKIIITCYDENEGGEKPPIPPGSPSFYRKRKSGCAPGFVNLGFVDDQIKENYIENKIKKSNKTKWQRQLSSFHTEMSHQKFSEQQKKTLRSYSSANYMPAHSITYVRWMKIHRSNLLSKLDLDRWFLILLIGLLVGLVATLLKQCIQGLNKWQWRLTRTYINSGYLGTGFAYLACTNFVMVFVGAVLVTMFHPPAMGGGAPEVIAFLNGIRIHGTLSVKNLVAKFTANVLAVGSGLPAAIQGPLITYGAIVGAGIGQFQSKPFHFSPEVFKRFRNAEDRRAFTTDGVAAGVSAGFHSPIGGLLFAMEDLSSFWSKGLSWQTFFCSVVATVVAQMFNTAFNSFRFVPPFGFFNLSVVIPIRMHVILFFPAILLGFLGGLLGAVFTRLNVLISQKRKFFLSKIKKDKLQLLIRILEPCFLVVIMTAYTVFLPLGFKCLSVDEIRDLHRPQTNYSIDPFRQTKFLNYSNCPSGKNSSFYNQMATLIQGGGTGYLDQLWSRSTFFVYDWYICLCSFVIYFPLTIITASSAIAGGIFVPVLVSGSLIGRTLGVAFMHAYRASQGQVFPDEMFKWLDPGVMAAIGGGALLSGVNRLEVASTVILVEMVGDINLVLPVLIAIFVSKAVANKLSKALYKYQLEGKALPFLDSEPQLVIFGKISNMELWRAMDIMASPVMTIQLAESIHKVSKLLLDTKHSSFPVVKYDELAQMEVVHGIITRNELYSILANEDVYNIYHEHKCPDSIIDPKISYEELDPIGVENVEKVIEVLKSYTMRKDINTRINLELFINMSVTKVDGNYSLMRTYRLFRTMGLRQLLVIDARNKPIGIITRKDLMQFNMQEKLEKLIGLEIPEDGSGNFNYIGNIPPNGGGGRRATRGRRMSRRFSVEEGSVLGTLVSSPSDPGATEQEEVIELPAVTRIRPMETITEEENNSSSDDANKNINNNQSNNNNDDSFDDNDNDDKGFDKRLEIDNVDQNNNNNDINNNNNNSDNNDDDNNNNINNNNNNDNNNHGSYLNKSFSLGTRNSVLGKTNNNNDKNNNDNDDDNADDENEEKDNNNNKKNLNKELEEDRM